MDEALSILEGFPHLLQDDFSVTGVVHQRYDFFTALFIQLTMNLRKLPFLSWTTTSCSYFQFLGPKFCFPLNGLEPPCQKSRATLAVVKMFLIKEGDNMLNLHNRQIIMDWIYIALFKALKALLRNHYSFTQSYRWW